MIYGGCVPMGYGKPTKKEIAEQKKMEKKWRADSDLDTLIRAEEIKKDPERLKEAMKLHGEMTDTLNKIEAGTA